ncbi:MAG TPA: VOC family protein [Acidimicrobiia bacterium]|nr:VOC family protein [Acidimicrobiia bacterium]
MRYRHVAVFVGPDLRAAEEYYARLFGLQVVVREAPQGGGGIDAAVWAQLPQDKTWDDAEAAGVEIGMVGLERDDVTLALFPAAPTGERFYAVGLVATRDEIEAVAGRLADETIEDHREEWLAFLDRYGVRWQLSTRAPFRGAGDSQGRWLDV